MPHEFRTRLHGAVRNAGRREIGGVLMAEQIEPGSFRLVDFSVDSRSGGAAHFVRSVEHHQEALEAFFERTGADYGRFNYLGEWHSHPNHPPVPSGEDAASMRDLVGGERDIPFAVLLIVRASRRGLMCTATLFEHGADVAEVALRTECIGASANGELKRMAKTKPPQKIAAALWALAGGRCEYRGCNENLVGDLISGKRDALFGYIAHIVGDSEDGPRGNKVLSPKLAKELSNLMLLCGRHHKLIDVDDEEGHPVELLHAMKDAHETRIATNTGISEEYASHVLRFGASIGNHEALVSTQAIFAAMPPDRHPATSQTIDLEMLNQAIRDDEPEFWEVQRKNLDRLFADRIGGRIERQEIRHLSVFALAPQPLLIELGRLLNEIVPVTVHNRHREPTATWNWQRDRPVLDFLVSRPEARATGKIALKIAVSATVNDDRVIRVLGDDAAIWTITLAKPGNDVVRQPEDLSVFRTTLREVYNEIKAQHGEGQVIHLFPVMPASLAVETGRIWMPKADLEMLIYDQNREKGFVPTLSIGAPVAK